MTNSQTAMGAAFEKHYEKQFTDAEKLREATKDDPDRPKPTSFYEAGDWMVEQMQRVTDYKREHRND